MRIEQAGTYKLSSFGAGSANRQVVYISGTGTAELGYMDDYGNWIPITGGALVPGKQYQVYSGGSSPVMIKITGTPLLSIQTLGIS